MLCVKCKKEIPEGSGFCLHCGANQKQKQNKKTKRPNGAGTVYKLSGRRKRPWAARVTIGYKKDGKREDVIIGYFETRTEALSALNASADKPITKKVALTLDEVFEEWSQIHFKTIKESGVNNYNAAWRYLQSRGNIKMRDMRTAHFQTAIDEAVESGKSRSTCEKIKQLCSQLCKYALENDIISKNYADFLRLPKTTKTKKEKFSDVEIQKFFNDKEDETSQIILTLIFTGFRIGELFSVEKKRVNLEMRYIVGGFKTEAGTDRVVPINEKILPFVEHWYHSNDSNFLICNSAGGQLDVKNFRARRYYPKLEELGIKQKPPHTTRHTFASLMSRAGVQPEILQKIIGHSDYSTTANIYIHEDFDQLADAIRKI